MGVMIANKESIQYDSYVSMETIVCYKCAIPFGVPMNYKKHLQASQDGFYCPNGHYQSYSKSTEAILREKIAKIEADKEKQENYLRNQIKWKEEQILSKKKEVTVLKSKATKLKNRIVHGVCPCCGRTFQNMYEHIKHMHPDYKNETT